MAKSGLIVFFILCCISLAGVIIIGGNQNHQPIQYNHKLHVEEEELDCLECHLNAGTHARASIPNINVCSDCHDDLEAENAEDRKVAEYVSADTFIPWIQVYKVPDHAYFSHRRHVTLGKIECQECHGDVGQMEKPIVEPIQLIEMSWCVECHEQTGVSGDCLICHR